jgi:hemerythrin-like domain-containing protein
MDGVNGENLLTASLRRDHEVILRALERLEERVAEWKRTGMVDPAVLRRFVEFARTFVDRCHHGKEERCLFPCLERRGIPREGGPIGVMLYEHQLGRELVARLDEGLRALEGSEDGAVGAILSTCDEYIQLLRNHITKENGVLFPMGESVVEMEDVAEVGGCYERVEEVEVGREAHERLERFVEEV